MRLQAFPSLVLLSVILLPLSSRAQWQPDGTPVSAAQFDQAVPQLASDGAGGAIIAWQDSRNGAIYDIYTQRVNALGMPQWTADGVVLCNLANDQTTPTVLADGSGGAFIVWIDQRLSPGLHDIYAQRVNAAGAIQWTANGVAVCTAAGSQLYPKVIPDGSGGLIITWQDARGAAPDIYAQRLNSAGVPQWAANGVSLCTATLLQGNPRIVSDAAGGAIVTWEDYRAGAGTSDVYAQRVNGAGTAQWTFDGVIVSNATNHQVFPAIASDGGTGAIIAWQDLRGGATYDIYAQRFNSAGTAQWTANGQLVCGAANTQNNTVLVSDGAGGAIIAWTDQRIAPDIYAQRINTAGSPQWVVDGVAVCTANGNQFNPAIAADGAGGAFLSWEDFRVSTFDAYAQRITGFGNVQWTANGVVLSTAASNQQATAIIADGAGGAIVAFHDTRAGFQDVYAQRVDASYGYWGHPEPVVTSVADVKHDQGGKVAVNWTASGRDLVTPATIDFYSVWRAVDVSPLATAGTLMTLDQIRPDTPAGKRTRIQTSSYYWELVKTQKAYRLPSYSLAADTRADSVLANAGTEFFMVMAHDKTDEHIAFPSNALSGHSVDNLAPPAPLFLTAQRVGANVNLKWNRVHVPDLRDYSVYRKTSAGVTPLPPNFLADSDDTVLVDAGAPASTLYYIVTAYDVHDNQGPKSNEASVSALTGVGNLPPISALTVQNHPNPFAGTTELQIGLPAPSDVSLEVYDVAGRRVHAQSLPKQAAGWRTVKFDGRDSAGRVLASGVYFCRVTANGTTVTRKMVIAR